MSPSGNAAELLLRAVERHPDRTALFVPTKRDEDGVRDAEDVTFREFGDRVARLASGMRARGFRPLDRVVLLFPFSVDLYATVAALLARGVVAVFIDSGMGKRAVMGTIGRLGARAVIGTERLVEHALRVPELQGVEKVSVDSEGPSVAPFKSLVGEATDLEVVPRERADHALVTFTSGSTGVPKGVDRTHGLLIAQHATQSAAFPERDGDVDMPSWPVLALHNLCSGITTVLPPVDLRAPGTADGRLVLQSIADKGVTRLSGAPAYMTRLVEHMERTGVRAPSVERLFVGGGPVPVPLARRIRSVFPDAECTILYGSSEAEPMASVPLDEMLEAHGEGFLVGRPCAPTRLEVLHVPEPPPALDERGVGPLAVERGEWGEVVVSGPHVSPRYLDDPEADRRNKLACPDGTVWHRTGDVGHLDAKGRLWLTGRAKDLVRRDGNVLHPLPLEAALDAVDGVARSALVASASCPDGVVLLEVEGDDVAAITQEVRRVLATRGVAGLDVRVAAAVPVDARHNTKIDRGALRDLVDGRRAPG